jgi:hypothetical protein
VPYDPRKRNGWARALIHFHTQFSDGWASVLRAGEIAREAGYDFLIVTDHLRNLKLFTHRTLDEYIRACDEASHRLDFPVIPGGEMELHWNDPATTDFSEAHTLAFSIRALAAAGEYDWTTPGTDPFAHWTDSQGGRGTILALQEKLRAYNIPPAASHQFQHSLLSARLGAQSDYRYDLPRLTTSRYLDFFYSGAVELIHEMEDILLVVRQSTSDTATMKGVYASCDFHMGPQTTWPRVAKLLQRVPALGTVYRWLFKFGAATFFRLKGEAEAAAFPWFADEQLSHATYVYLGEEPCNERTVLEALRDGRTCVTRGAAQFSNFDPPPSFSRSHPSPARLHLSLPVSYSDPRPRSVIVFRNGEVVHWEPYAIPARAIEFTYTDPSPLPGAHVYQVYVPSKFLSSPIVCGG